MEGYNVKTFGRPTKRYCQTLSLKDDEKLIAMARLTTLPRQAEWEETVAAFQQCAAGATSDEKWQGMKRIFYLYED